MRTHGSRPAREELPRLYRWVAARAHPSCKRSKRESPRAPWLSGRLPDRFGAAEPIGHGAGTLGTADDAWNSKRLPDHRIPMSTMPTWYRPPSAGHDDALMPTKGF